MHAIESLARVDDKTWDRFVAGHPCGHFLQSSAWGRLRAAQGWELRRVLLADTSEAEQAPPLDTFRESAEKRVRLGLLLSTAIQDNAIETDQDKVMAKRAAIIGGEKIFVGPIKDQKGAEKVAAGAAMSDEEMLGMTWFVEGVVGTTE